MVGGVVRNDATAGTTTVPKPIEPTPFVGQRTRYTTALQASWVSLGHSASIGRMTPVSPYQDGVVRRGECLERRPILGRPGSKEEREEGTGRWASRTCPFLNMGCGAGWSGHGRTYRLSPFGNLLPPIALWPTLSQRQDIYGGHAQRL